MSKSTGDTSGRHSPGGSLSRGGPDSPDARGTAPAFSVDAARLPAPAAALKRAAERAPSFASITLSAAQTTFHGHALSARFDGPPGPVRLELSAEPIEGGIALSGELTNEGSETQLLDWVSPLWQGAPCSVPLVWPEENPAELLMSWQPLWMGGGGVSPLAARSRELDFWACRSYWSGAIGRSAGSFTVAGGFGEWANTQLSLNGCIENGGLSLAFICELSTDRHGRPLRLSAGETLPLNRMLLVGAATRREAERRYREALRAAVTGAPSPARSGIFSGYAMSARDGGAERVADDAFFDELLRWCSEAGARDYGLTLFKTQFSRFSTGPREKSAPARPAVWPEDSPEANVERILSSGFVTDYDLSERLSGGPAALVKRVQDAGFTSCFDSRPFLNFDASSPEHDRAAAELYRRIVSDWGYEALMFDFVSTDFESRDDRRTMSSAIRERFEAIREAVGEEIYIEACMCPPAPLFGLADGYRPAEDWRPGSEAILAGEIAPRNLYHGVSWSNDLEFFDPSIRPAAWDAWHNRAMQSIRTVRQRATLQAMSGYAGCLGGFLPETTAERWHIATRAVPADSQPALLLDYPEQNPPRLWAKRREIAGEPFWVVTLFNWNREQTAELSLSPETLFSLIGEPDVPQRLYVKSFWDKTVCGSVRPQRELTLTASAGDVAVYSFAEHRTDRPTYLGSSRHITGDGGLLHVEASPSALSGSARYSGDTTLELYWALPPGFIPQPAECEGCRCELIAPELMQVELSFSGAGSRDFRVPFGGTHYTL